MQVVEGWTEFAEACLDTPINAVCLKKKGVSIADADSGKDFGLLVSPSIARGMLNSRDDLRQKLDALSQSVVKVRGHGWPGETPFVWTGTVDEFNSTWTVD